MLKKIAWFVAGIIVASSMGTAFAANGGSIVIGRSNSATATTTLTNSKGTALKLTSKSGTAPFAVSNSTKVSKLNADLIDGKDSTTLVNQATNAARSRWALIDFNGIVVRQYGGITVENVFTGGYCITVPGIDARSHAAVATVDYDNSDTSFVDSQFASVEMSSGNYLSAPCSSVSDFVVLTGTKDIVAGTSDFANNGFSFMVAP